MESSTRVDFDSPVISAQNSSDLAELGRQISNGYRENCEPICKNIELLVAKYDLVEFFFEQLSNDNRSIMMAGAQSYILYSDDNFYARLNFWPPERRVHEVIDERFRKYFSIGVLHNHSFDFFTVRILGPRYASDFYEARLSDIEGINLGDSIDLVNTRSLQLSIGTTLFVRKSYDFHVQFEPSSFSLSLNFIPKKFDSVGTKDNTQIIVDMETMKVSRKFIN